METLNRFDLLVIIETTQNIIDSDEEFRQLRGHFFSSIKKYCRSRGQRREALTRAGAEPRKGRWALRVRIKDNSEENLVLFEKILSDFSRDRRRIRKITYKPYIKQYPSSSDRFDSDRI